jgi:hypothetical protein
MKKYVSWLRLVLIVLTAMSLATPLPRAYAEQADDPQSDVPNEQFAFDFTDSQMRILADTFHVSVQTFTTELSQGKDALADLIDKQDGNVLVSSDETGLLETAAKESPRVAVLPFGKAVQVGKDVVGGLNAGLRQIRNNVVWAAKNDKIRLALVTFSTGTDVFRWIHVDHMSTFAQTSTCLYIVLVNSILSLNDNKRNEIISPLEKVWNKILKVSSVEQGQKPTHRQALSDFLTNLSVASILNTGFIATISLDKLVAGTFEAKMLAVPLLLGIVTTAASFSWYEFKHQIDEKTHPLAKKAAQSLLNTRTFVISWMASSALLLNYHQHGIEPWIVLTMSGLVGFPLYFNAQKFAEWYESNPAVQVTAKMFQEVKKNSEKLKARARTAFGMCAENF